MSRSRRWSRRVAATRRVSCSSRTCACERDVQATVNELRQLDVVRRVNSLIRVLGTEAAG